MNRDLPSGLTGLTLDEQMLMRLREQEREAFRKQSAMLMLAPMLAKADIDEPLLPLVKRAPRAAELLTTEVMP